MKADSANGPGLVVALGAPGQNGEMSPGDPNAESQANNVDTVPLDTLAMPDDQEQMQPPEVGDVVNYQVTGKVVAIEGNMAKVERQSINGQDLPDAPDETDDQDANPQDANNDDEQQGLRSSAAGIGMMVAILFFGLIGLICPIGAEAQNAMVVGNASYTNMLIAATTPVKLYAVTGYNSAGSTEYIQIFQTNSVPASGAVPTFSIPVASQQYFDFDFSYYGADLDSVIVCSSTSPTALSLSAVNCSMQAIIRH